MVYLFLANGFEMIEALTPVDLLRRAGVELKTVSINKSKTVFSTHNVGIEADMTIDEMPSFEILTSTLDGIILPGGMPGAKNLDECKKLDEIIAFAATLGEYKKVIISAICAAPFILGKRGLLDGKKAICYPGFEAQLKGANVLSGSAKVAVDGNFITGKAMGCATEFALELVNAFCGLDKKEAVAQSIYY